MKLWQWIASISKSDFSRTAFPTPYIEGFIVIRSIVSLDVTAVYSTGSRRER